MITTDVEGRNQAVIALLASVYPKALQPWQLSEVLMLTKSKLWHSLRTLERAKRLVRVRGGFRLSRQEHRVRAESVPPGVSERVATQMPGLSASGHPIHHAPELR